MMGYVNSNNFFPESVLPSLYSYGGNGFKDVLLGSSGGSGSMVPFSSGFEEFDVRPCKYYARGICRNGDDCKFHHSDPARVFHGRCSRSTSSFGKKYSGSGSSASRQIYLTFPADSTFEDQDVYDYFSLFGPVDDVRIPYQTKRNFGFVSFVYAETVRRLLSMRTPHHIICNSNVMVKPYKEKEELIDKKKRNHQDMENRGRCSTSSRSLMIDPRQLYDLPVGPRQFNSQDMFRRRLVQEAELLGLSMEDLQLTDTNNHRNLYHGYHRSGVSCNLPIPFMNHQNNVVASSSNVPHQETLQELQDSSMSLIARTDNVKDEGNPSDRRSFERVEQLNVLPSSFKRDIGGGGADQSKN